MDAVLLPAVGELTAALAQVGGTDFLTTDSLVLPAETTAHYPAIREMILDHLKLQGSRLGDPVMGARAIIGRVLAGEGPLRQLLGSDAHSYAVAKVEALRANVEATALSAPATDFPRGLITAGGPAGDVPATTGPLTARRVRRPGRAPRGTAARSWRRPG
ncbi:hypothetical protein GCM10023074_53990 [Microbispora amethystogenes]|uniref:Uncharacterized protein n=1 Tax=Microbispora amethystogenes TaxID=1427754 RepID=A0ABQ4FHJ0_9ACTN|nr:hypothetical protein Mam01_44410 [Microbispora amethystogenes]